MTAATTRWPAACWIGAFLAWMLCVPCAAQSAASVPAGALTLSSSPDPGHQLQGAALVRALRDGGLVVYFRHTATDFSRNDREMRDFADCERQRPLNEQGRRDA